MSDLSERKGGSPKSANEKELPEITFITSWTKASFGYGVLKSIMLWQGHIGRGKGVLLQEPMRYKLGCSIHDEMTFNSHVEKGYFQI